MIWFPNSQILGSHGPRKFMQSPILWLITEDYAALELLQGHDFTDKCDFEANERPTMNEVIAQLQHDLALQEEAGSNTSGDYNLLSVTFDPPRRRDRINEKMRFDVGELSEESLDDWEGLDALAAHIANLLSTEPADGKIVRSPHGVMHGKSSLVYYDEKGEDGLFAGLSKYHSLVIEKESFPHEELEVTA
ncbi:hypothetical protein HN51_035514 [Arachis hypogaea]